MNVDVVNFDVNRVAAVDERSARPSKVATGLAPPPNATGRNEDSSRHGRSTQSRSWWRCPIETMRWATLALSWVLLSCGAPPLAERGTPLSRWSYAFFLDSGLSRLEATVCFEGEAPYALSPIDANGRRYLRVAQGPNGEPLQRINGWLLTEGLPEDSCIRYVVDLEAAALQRGGIHGAYRIGEDLVASTAVWLWAPAYRSPGAEAFASFDLPDGIVVSPLWARSGDGRYRLDERAFRFTAYAAFGRFRTRNVPVPGGCLHVSILGSGVEIGERAVTRGLSSSANAASMLLGRFPVPEAGLLVLPTPFSTSSPFGVVGRGTMPTVAILVGERATEERLARAWVPVHEFSHLATPFIDRGDAWLSEGVATYYQEVLRARGGLITEEQAWTHLDEGFVRGDRDGTGRSLAAESRQMTETAAFRRVYWAGAAIALMSDVEMRRQSNGQRSLDNALARLHRCCSNGLGAISADEALARLDGRGPRIMTTIAHRVLGSSQFPDLARTYSALGIERTARGLRFDSDPEARTLREAIMAPRMDLAPLPRECGPRRRGAR